MFLFKGLSLIIRRLSFNSNRNFLFSLARTLKFSKDREFILHNSFIVEAFLFFFIKSICFRELLLCISSGVGIKHPYIENLLCQNPGAHTSNLTSFPVAVDGAKDLPVKDCNCGSTRTSLHTSLRSDDVMSLTELCRNYTNPPFLQDRACWRSNFSPHSQYAGSFVIAHT